MSAGSSSGERILAILDLFSQDHPEWTPDEMMARLGYTRTTLYRYLKTLKDAGFLVSLPNAGFTLGPRFTELDLLMRASDPLIKTGEPHLKTVAAAHPGTAFLVRWYGRKLLCVASEVSIDNPQSSYPRGRPMPLSRGAIPLVILANLRKSERTQIVREQLEDFRTVGRGDTVEDVLTHLRQIRRDGYAVAHGEVTPGVIGVAAPILVADRSPIAVLCLTSNEADMTPARLDRITHDIRTMAEAISDELNHQPLPLRQSA